MPTAKAFLQSDTIAAIQVADLHEGEDEWRQMQRLEFRPNVGSVQWHDSLSLGGENAYYEDINRFD